LFCGGTPLYPSRCLCIATRLVGKQSWFFLDPCLPSPSFVALTCLKENWQMPHTEDKWDVQMPHGTVKIFMLLKVDWRHTVKGTGSAISQYYSDQWLFVLWVWCLTYYYPLTVTVFLLSWEDLFGTTHHKL